MAMASSPLLIPRIFSLNSRHLSTISAADTLHLLQSHSPSPPLETALSAAIPNPTPSLISSVISSAATHLHETTRGRERKHSQMAMAMASSPLLFPRFFSLNSRHLSTISAAETWHLLRSHSPPPPLETALSAAIPNPTPSLISSVISSATTHSDHLLSLRFFVWAGLHPLRRHSAAAYSALSPMIHPQPQLLHHLLDAYTLESIPVSSRTFKILLALCHHSGLPFPLALSLLSRMPLFGCSPDVPSYNALLRLPSAPAHVSTSLLDEMKASGLIPDVITYVSIIKILCAAGQLAAARDLLPRMRDDGCSPNVVVYSALLDGACSAGDLDSGLEILEQMEMERERDFNCGPNVVSYTCLMKCLCESGRLEEALGVLDRMGRNGCWPNRVTVRTLVKGFCEEGRVMDAYKVVERMVCVERGVSSEECYSVLVVCLLRVGDWEGAEGLLGRMLERGVKPNGMACNLVLREICGRRCFLDGYNWVGVLEENGVRWVDSDVYSWLLAGLCEEGHLVEAVKLGWKIVENGVRVEDSRVDRVVEVMDKIGEGDLASQIMRMKEESKSQLVV